MHSIIEASNILRGKASINRVRSITLLKYPAIFGIAGKQLFNKNHLFNIN